MSAACRKTYGLIAARRATAVTYMRWALMLATAGMCMPGYGQSPQDPTRPNAAWLASQPKATTEAKVAAEDPPPKLQSLIVGSVRKYALIDGQILSVGDRYRDGRVIEITATEVVLRTEQGTQMLKLYPDVKKYAGKPEDTGSVRLTQKGASQPAVREIIIKETK